jgi:hypothetical protein
MEESVASFLRSREYSTLVLGRGTFEFKRQMEKRVDAIM